MLIAAGVATWWTFQQLEKELAPLEDRGRLRISATAPEGASFDYMSDYMDRLSEMVSGEVPEAHMVISQTAPGFGGSGSVNTGSIRAYLVERHERERSQSEIAAKLLDATRRAHVARPS